MVRKQSNREDKYPSVISFRVDNLVKDEFREKVKGKKNESDVLRELLDEWLKTA